MSSTGECNSIGILYDGIVLEEIDDVTLTNCEKRCQLNDCVGLSRQTYGKCLLFSTIMFRLTSPEWTSKLLYCPETARYILFNDVDPRPGEIN